MNEDPYNEKQKAAIAYQQKLFARLRKLIEKGEQAKRRRAAARGARVKTR